MQRTPERTSGPGGVGALGPTTLPKSGSLASRPSVLHRLTGCAGAHVAPCCGARLPSRPSCRRRRAARRATTRPRPTSVTVSSGPGTKQAAATPPPGVRRGLTRRCDDQDQRACAVHRRRVFPGLPCREDVDAGPPRRPPGADRGLLGGGPGARCQPCRAPGTPRGRALPLARQAAVIVAAQAAANDECG